MERPNRIPRRTETPVVPLHAHRSAAAPARAPHIAPAEPAPRTSTSNAPAGAPGAGGARARRASNTREVHDGWTFVVVPPGAGARPRTLRVSVRRLRMAFAGLITLAGTAVVSGALLAVVLSMAPAIQPEGAGVEMGVLADLSGPRGLPVVEDDALAAALEGRTSGAPAPDSAPPATPAANAGSADRTKAPVVKRSTATNARERRRVIAAPSIMGRAEVESEAGAGVAMADANALPVIGRITSRFTNARRHPLLGVVRKHAGVDIAAASGTPIITPAAGRVIFSGRKFGFGNVVEIDHGHGVITRYAHARTLRVKTGAQVRPGATIATVGRTGLASGPHLHFEVLLNGRSVDPLKRPLGTLLPKAEAQPAESAAATSDSAAASPSNGADSTGTPGSGVDSAAVPAPAGPQDP